MDSTRRERRRNGSARGGGAADALRPQQVCARLDIQPYQLKFWEIEFPELGRRVGTKRLYDSAAVALAAEIRRLLVDERMNLDDARKVLGGDAASGGPGTGTTRESYDTPAPREEPARTRKGGDRPGIHALERALAGARAALEEQARIHEMELEKERAAADELREHLRNVEAELAEARSALEQARLELEAQRSRTEAAQRETRSVRGRACDELSAMGADLRTLGAEIAALLAAMGGRRAGPAPEAPAPPAGKPAARTRRAPRGG